MSISINIPKGGIGKIAYSGLITVTEEVPGDIELVVESSKCSLDMKDCEKYSNINIHGMCQKFNEKKAFYSGALASIKPPLKCPLKPGNYTLEESELDLTPVSMIPLDGFIWVVTFKFVSSEAGSKTKKIAMCLNSETKIVRTNKRVKS